MKTINNKVNLIGNLGQDPEFKEVGNGNKLAKFSLATNEFYKDKTSGEFVNNTQWHNVIIWGYLADRAAKKLKKGEKVAVEGQIQYSTYEDSEGNKKSYTQIRAVDFEALGNKRSEV